MLERLISTTTTVCACGVQPPPTAEVQAFPALLDSIVQGQDVHKRTPLHHAAWVGSPESVRRLCTVLTVQGRSVDSMDECGWTPLHLACAAGNTACIDHLLEAGAKSDAPDLMGWSPVHHAAMVRPPVCWHPVPAEHSIAEPYHAHCTAAYHIAKVAHHLPAVNCVIYCVPQLNVYNAQT